MDLPVRRLAPRRQDQGVQGPGGVLGQLEHAGQDRVPRSAATWPASVANGPSSGSASGARSEPGSPKSRANASGSTTRSVPAGGGPRAGPRFSAGSRPEACCTRRRTCAPGCHRAPVLAGRLARLPRVGLRRRACWPAVGPRGSTAPTRPPMEVGGPDPARAVLWALVGRPGGRGGRRRACRPSRPVTFVARGARRGWAGRGAAGRARRRASARPPPDLVVVLAVDMPLVTADTVGRLRGRGRRARRRAARRRGRPAPGVAP